MVNKKYGSDSNHVQTSVKCSVICFARWKSGRVCRTGRLCTFAHGQQELKSWKEHAKMDLPATKTEATSAEKSSGETTGKATDTFQSEVVN